MRYAVCLIVVAIFGFPMVGLSKIQPPPSTKAGQQQQLDTYQKKLRELKEKIKRLEDEVRRFQKEVGERTIRRVAPAPTKPKKPTK